MTATEMCKLQEQSIWDKISKELTNAITNAAKDGNSFVIVRTSECDEYAWEDDFENLKKLGYEVHTPEDIEYSPYEYSEYNLDNRYDYTIIRWNKNN